MLKTKGAAESGVESWIVFVLYSTIYHHLSNANPRLIPLGCLIGGHHLSRFFISIYHSSAEPAWFINQALLIRWWWILLMKNWSSQHDNWFHLRNEEKYQQICNLVGGWPTPLKNDGLRQLGSLFPTEWKNKIHVPNHQPVMVGHCSVYTYASTPREFTLLISDIHFNSSSFVHIPRIFARTWVSSVAKHSPLTNHWFLFQILGSFDVYSNHISMTAGTIDHSQCKYVCIVYMSKDLHEEHISVMIKS